MTFAQALARIERLNEMLSEEDDGSIYYGERFNEHKALLIKHADSIVQLCKMAEKLASTVTAGASIGARGERDLYQQARVLQTLMNGEEG